MRADHYDGFARNYAAENASSLLNEWYERPAMIGLAADVAGHRILDAGCGAGLLSAALAARGAHVSGFDGSPAMIELARRSLGTGADLTVADLREPLPYPAASFDDVVCSLVLHYLEDWSGPLAEFHRILKPGGRLLLSVNHPFIYKVIDPSADYFAPVQYSQELLFNGHPAVLTQWHRPLHAMTDAFADAGFRIQTVSEPPLAPDAPGELLPEHLAGRDAFVSFIFFVLEAAGPGA